MGGKKPWPFIYLASASPRRHEILCQMGVPHEVLHVPAPEGEDEPILPGESPEHYVARTAREKAERASQWLSRQSDLRADTPILCADTTVSLNNDILGKPANLAEAARMLECLSGNTHEVRTAVVLVASQRSIERVSLSHVTFCKLSKNDIQEYCLSGEPMGKAGAYGIQGRAGMFVQHLSGSYTGVMGLPMYETSELLKLLSSYP